MQDLSADYRGCNGKLVEAYDLERQTNYNRIKCIFPPKREGPCNLQQKTFIFSELSSNIH